MAAGRKVNAARSTIRWHMRIGLPAPPALQVIARRRAPRVPKVIAGLRGLRAIAVRLGLRVIAVPRGLRAATAANAGLAAATALADRALPLAKPNC